ncbi:hypothetical protein ASF71_21195 [Deinococcus sp. Leaf326]|nr:hypothetical protein ASF71_21195 [Deinococcus sp. Leaf326]
MVEPRSFWTVLDERSFDVLVAMTRREGRRGFGVQEVVHEIVVHLDQPRPRSLAFQVSWGFPTPSYDMGFFLPALEDDAPESRSSSAEARNKTEY